MVLAALAAGLFLISDAPQSTPSADVPPPAAAAPDATAMVKKRVCREVRSTGSRTPRKECETVMVPAAEAEAARQRPVKPAEKDNSSSTGGA